MELSKVIEKLESEFPLFLKEEWDNCGLILGELKRDIKRVMITLDVTDDVISEAVKQNIDMIISHHPLVFKPLNSVTSKTITGKRILKIIKENIVLYTAHTNADAALSGLNDYIARKLGGERLRTADIKYYDTLKLVCFVPESHFEEVRNKMIKINRFSYRGFCGVTYSGNVEETYIAGDDSQTSLSNGRKIEMIVYKNQVKEIINEIKKIHPYIEPAYELVETDKRFESGGIGKIFELEEAVDIEKYLMQIKEKLNLKTIKSVFDKGMKIKKIGVVNGSGMSFVRKMREYNIDLFITADIKYHEALEARELGLALADIGHYESECFFGEMVKEKLDEFDLEIFVFNDKPVFEVL